MAEIFSSINASTPNSVARAIANEVVAGKNAIASALVTKGQSVTSVDTFNTMANKVLAITGEINVTPIQNIPSDWHDLAQVIASNTLSEFPYVFGILITKAMESIQLTGSNRYITSDGGFYSGDQIHIFDRSKDDSSSDTYATFTGTLCGMSSSVTIKANHVGSVGNIKLTGNGTSINSLITAWNTANPTKTVTITSGDGAQIPLSGFYGLVAGMTTAVEICQNAGGDWGQITLVANGTSNISTLISAWNAANATKQITLKSGVDTQVPTANIVLNTENIQLTGGVIGNSGKSTRWVLFCNNSDNIKPIYNFNSIVNNESLTIARRFLQLYVKNVYLDNIICGWTYLRRLTFDASYNLDITLQNVSHFAGCNLGEIIIPEGVQRFKVTGASALQSSGITAISLPSTLLEFSVTVSGAAQQNPTDYFISTASSILNMYGLGFNNSMFGGSCKYFKYKKPSSYFSKDVAFESGASINHVVVDLDLNWNFTISFYSSSTVYSDFSYWNLIAMLSNLVDYRGDGVNTPTITANGTTAITINNGNCLNVHHVGETIYINGVSKVIQSITDATHMIMTTTVTSGTNVSYGANKVLTVGSANTAKLTAAEIAVATAKGWTIN